MSEVGDAFETKIDPIALTASFTTSNGAPVSGEFVSTTVSGSVNGYSESGTISSVRLSADISQTVSCHGVFMVNNTTLYNGSAKNTSIDVEIDPELIADGHFSFNFMYKTFGYNRSPDGVYRVTLSATNVVLSLTYSDISPEPPPVDVEVYIATQEEDYIVLFDEESDDYSTNGDIVLMPEKATVKEEAGGSFDLEITHPLIEPYISHFAPGAIIRSPVPERMLPDIDAVEISLWKVKSTVAKCNVYSQACTTTTTTTTTVTPPAEPPVAKDFTQYHIGDVVQWDGYVYTCYNETEKGSAGAKPIIDGSGWQPYWHRKLKIDWMAEHSTTTTETKYKDTPIVATMIANEVFTHISDVGTGWMRIRTKSGTNGYVQTSQCELYESHTDQVESKAIRRQLFRIFKIKSDTKTRTVTIQARHISYDFGNVILGKCEPTGMDGPTAIALIESSEITDDDNRMIITDITDKKIEDVDWSWKNAINAILDPSDGAVSLLSAQLFRDNADFFLIANNPQPSGYTLEFGKNLERLQWEASTEELVTRIIPRAKNSDDSDLLLPEVFIDSPHLSDYSIPYVGSMDIGWKVGEKRKVNGEEKTLELNDVYEQMRTESKKQYTDYKVDEPDLDITVDLIDIGNSIEYEHLKGFQRLRLYDQVTVVCEPLGFTSTQQIVGYEFDAINSRYTKITLGDPFDTGRRNGVK